MVEYALLLLLVALVAMTAVGLMGQEHSELWSEIDSSLDP